MTAVGADVGELERLAFEFDRAADDLDADGGQLTRLLGNVSWLGDVASKYVGNWTGVHLPRIGLSTRFLRDAAASLRQQAEQQRSASSAIGGRISPTPVRPTVLERHLATIRAALDPGGLGVTRLDLDKIRTTVLDLSPGEQRELFARLSDQELRILKDQMQEGRLKGGWTSEQQRDFLGAVLPNLDPRDAARLMGEDWCKIRYRFEEDALRTPTDLLGRLIDRTSPSADHLIADDEIEIRRLDNGRYIVVLPGVVDLVEGLRRGLVDGSTLPYWDDPDPSGSVRDMHYARQAEMNSENGSTDGTNAYAFAVKEAMRAAGVPDGADVMLVGHSYGAYTVADLAADPTFNELHGAGGSTDGYSVRITHVAAAGAAAGDRMNDIPGATRGILINSINDVAYRVERALPTNGANSPYEVQYSGGLAGAGHDPSNYSEFVRSGVSDQTDGFAQSAFESYGGPSEVIHIVVKDPYRVPAN